MEIPEQWLWKDPEEQPNKYQGTAKVEHEIGQLVASDETTGERRAAFLPQSRGELFRWSRLQDTVDPFLYAPSTIVTFLCTTVKSCLHVCSLHLDGTYKGTSVLEDQRSNLPTRWTPRNVQ